MHRVWVCGEPGGSVRRACRLGRGVTSTDSVRSNRGNAQGGLPGQSGGNVRMVPRLGQGVRPKVSASLRRNLVSRCHSGQCGLTGVLVKEDSTTDLNVTCWALQGVSSCRRPALWPHGHSGQTGGLATQAGTTGPGVARQGTVRTRARHV